MARGSTCGKARSEMMITDYSKEHGRYFEINTKSGKTYTMNQYVKKTGVSMKRFSEAIKAGKPVEELNALVEDQRFRDEKGYAMTTRVYRRIEADGRVTRRGAGCLKKHGIPLATAYVRLAEWERGERSTDDLLKPLMSVEQRMKLSQNRNNGLKALSGKDRSDRLAAIPGGGTWERRYLKGGPVCAAGRSREVAHTRGQTGAIIPCYRGD